MKKFIKYIKEKPIRILKLPFLLIWFNCTMILDLLILINKKTTKILKDGNIFIDDLTRIICNKIERLGG